MDIKMILTRLDHRTVFKKYHFSFINITRNPG